MKKWSLLLIASFLIATTVMSTPTGYSQANLAQADTSGSERDPSDRDLPYRCFLPIVSRTAGLERDPIDPNLPPISDTMIVRVYYPNLDIAARVFISFEGNMLETNYEEGYHVMVVDQDDIARLTAAGLRVEVDPERTIAQYSQPRTPTPAQESGIPGYSCYRTVEETYAAAGDIANRYPNLATWTDRGDSWEKNTGSGGHDMMVLRLTNSAVSGPKPRLFITASIHAREYTPAELVTRFAEYLMNNYDSDPNVTWLLDYHEIHLMLQANPDGRKIAEQGYPQRKNTNNSNGGSCDDPPTLSNHYGTDLNRNFQFLWGCCGYPSSDPCAQQYRGPSAASEPETQAIQNYMRAQFPDQRDDDLSAPAPADATGVFLDIHSYSNLVLWPWGFTSTPAPNTTALQTLGGKLAYWNGYVPKQSFGLYPTEGTTIDFAYGELGVAAYLFELGTAFFQDCSTFEDIILPDNLSALIFAAKVARTPYTTPAGPDAIKLSLSAGTKSPGVLAGTPVTLSATIDDTRYNNSNDIEPTQNIAAAECYIDTPPWVTAPTPVPITMSPADGSFNSQVENVEATIDTKGLSKGRHIVFVRGQDADGDWGAFTAIFLYITEDTSPPVSQAELNGQMGENGWFASDVAVTLTAEDDLSGVEAIYYRLDGGDFVEGTMFTVHEGRHTVEFYSVDKVGNAETIQSIQINVDKTPPVVNVQIDQPEYTRLDSFVIHYDAYDPEPGSGLHTLVADLNGELVTDGQVIDLFGFDLGTYTLAATAEDHAGWSTINSASFELMATIEGMKATVDRLCDEGLITNEGICNSLRKKLDAAQGARDRGQIVAALDTLQAFQNEVDAQTGKHIQPEAARVLLMDSSYVISLLSAG